MKIKIELIDRGKVMNRGEIECDNWDCVVDEYTEISASVYPLWVNIPTQEKIKIPADYWVRL